MKRLLFALLLIIIQTSLASDTLAIRLAHLEQYMPGTSEDINQSYTRLPTANIDWANCGITHVVYLAVPYSGFNTSTGLPSFAATASDSTHIFMGDINQPGMLDSIIAQAHRAGVYVLLGIAALDGSGSGFNTICASLTLSQNYWTWMVPFLLRHHIDGIDLDQETNSPSSANLAQWAREGRKRGYNAQFPNGKMIMGASDGTLNPSLYVGGAADTCFDYYAPQMYGQRVWSSSCAKNISYWNGALAIPSITYPSGSELKSINYTYGTGRNMVEEWVAAGHARKKVGPLLSASGVFNYPVTSMAQCANDATVDKSRYYVASLGTPVRNSQAMSPYTVSGGAIYPYGDSTYGKAVADSVKKWGGGVIGMWSFGKDGEALGSLSNHALDYYRFPTVSGTLAYAKSLSNGSGSSVTSPTAITVAASSIAKTTATVNATVDANGASTTVMFVWGTVSGTYTDSAAATQSPVTGVGNACSYGITGLSAQTTYYFKVRGYNSAGNGAGSELSFKTLDNPSATTSAASLVTQSSATLNGSVTPNGASTTVRFVYGTVSGTYTDSITALQSPLSASYSSSSVSGSVTGLSATTTYYFRVRGYNSAGNAQGSELNFTTSTPVTIPRITTRIRTR